MNSDLITEDQLLSLISVCGSAIVNMNMAGMTETALDAIKEIADEEYDTPINMLALWLAECAAKNVRSDDINEKLSSIYARHENDSIVSIMQVEIGVIDTLVSDKTSGEMYVKYIKGLDKNGKIESVVKMGVIATHAAAGYVLHMRECGGNDSE